MKAIEQIKGREQMDKEFETYIEIKTEAYSIFKKIVKNQNNISVKQFCDMIKDYGILCHNDKPLHEIMKFIDIYRYFIGIEQKCNKR